MRYLLPLLITMICPLMMFFMMRGGHGSHGQAAATHEHGHAHSPATRSGPPSLDELRSLRDEFEDRLEKLDDRIFELEQAENERPAKVLART
jgi:hypothetical protein